jgi:hypothetical protein
MHLEIWTCDFFPQCKDVARCYRLYNGELLKLCAKHEMSLAHQHMGKRIDYSELDSEDLQYLREKQRGFEYYKKVHFALSASLSEEEYLIKIDDRLKSIHRSFKIQSDDFDMIKFLEFEKDVENGSFATGYSIDDIINLLKERISKKI